MSELDEAIRKRNLARGGIIGGYLLILILVAMVASGQFLLVDSPEAQGLLNDWTIDVLIILVSIPCLLVIGSVIARNIRKTK